MYNLEYIKNNKKMLLERKEIVLSDLRTYLKIENEKYYYYKKNNIKKIKEIKKLLKYFKWKNTCIGCFLKFD